MPQLCSKFRGSSSTGMRVVSLWNSLDLDLFALSLWPGGFVRHLKEMKPCLQPASRSWGSVPWNQFDLTRGYSLTPTAIEERVCVSKGERGAHMPPSIHQAIHQAMTMMCSMQLDKASFFIYFWILFWLFRKRVLSSFPCRVRSCLSPPTEPWKAY